MAPFTRIALSLPFILLVTTVAIVVPFLVLPKFLTQGEILKQLKYYLQDEFKPKIKVGVKFADEGFRFPDLVKAAQIQVDHELNHRNVSLKIDLVDYLQQYPNNTTEPEYFVELIHSNENSVAVENDSLKVITFYTLKAVHANDLPFYVTQSVVDHLLSPQVELFQSLSTKQLPFYNSSTQFDIISIGGNQTENPVQSSLQTFSEAMSEFSNVTMVYHHFPKVKPMIKHIKEKDLSGAYFIYSHSNISLVKVIDYPIFKIGQNDSNEILLEQQLNTIQDYWGLPDHPNENYALKVVALSQYHTLEILKAYIEILQSFVKDQKDCTTEIKSLYLIIDELHYASNKDWLELLSQSDLLYRSIKVT